MAFSALAVAIGASLLKALFDKSMEKTADTILSKTVARAKEKLEKRLKLGKYQVIQRALTGARRDVLDQCESREQRQRVGQILDDVLKSNSDSLLTEFSTHATQIYLLPSIDSPPLQPLSRLYRNTNDSAALLMNQDETALDNIFNAFFSALRERLLREPDFAYLREYTQLSETRLQTTVQQAILQQVTTIAVNTTKPVENFASVHQQYCDYLVKELKDHVIRGFSPQVSGRVLSLSLAKIFLPLQAVEGRPALAEYAEEDLQRQAASEVAGELDWQRRREEMEKRYAQLSARQSAQRSLNLAELLKNSRSVLLGDPGTGKTTVTRYITYALASDDATHTGSSVQGLTPVLVRIANYAKAYERDNTLHLIEYVEKELTTRPEFGCCLRQAIEAGECLIILDGLDEVTNPNLRIQITDRIQEMVAGFSANRFMVTSRIVGYDVSPLTREFKHATLRELSEDDRERFVRLWYDAIKSAISDSTQAEGAEDLIDALRTKPQIARMGANPLLLTIMVLMHWRGYKLPSRRVQVYQIATDTLIEYWTVQRDVTELEAEEMKAILAPIAHYILSSNVGGVIAHRDLQPRFYSGIAEQRGCDANEARRIGQKLLKDLSEQSGLFLERGRDTNDQPVYGFLHQTFGEYLAALHLAQQVLGNSFVLRDYIHRSMWHEPLLLLTSHLSIISQAHANNLLREILDFPAPYEDMLQRNLLLAADCLADDIQVRFDLRDEVLKKLAGLLQHVAPQVCEAVADRYRRLAATRHREAAMTALKNAYPLANLDELNKMSPEIRFNLATSLIHLNEKAIAQSILWQLEKEIGSRSNTRYIGERDPNPVRIDQIQRLRFKHWPEQAADYLLQLYTNKASEFSITTGEDLSNCILGPINAEQAHRVLGEDGFRSVIDALLNRCSKDDDRAALRWMAILAAKTPAIERLLEPTQSEVPAQIRYFAAKRLLGGEHRAVAIAVLQDLVASESEQASAAALSLREAKEDINLNWQLLRDTALMVNDESTPKAMDTLLKAGALEFALPAALYFLSSLSNQEYWKRDNQLRSIVESLIEHEQNAIGSIAAHWLALRPGYRHRLKLCELLLGAGYVEPTIPLLQYLIYEHHDEDCQSACQRLLILKEAEKVVSLLKRVACCADPKSQYLAYQALALANCTPAEDFASTPSRIDLRMAIWADRMSAFQKARQEFCQVGFEALEALRPSNEQARSALELARLSLKCLAGSFAASDLANDLDQLLNDPWPAIRVNAALFALRFGQIEKSKQVLIKMFTQVDSLPSLPVRLQALKILGQLAGPETVPILVEALKDKDNRVRRVAARALGPHGDSYGVQALIAALNDTDKKVRGSAARSLGQLGDPASVPTLTSVLKDEDKDVRRAAADALRALGERSAVSYLIDALRDTDSQVRSAAAQALRELEDSDADQALINALNDKDRFVRSTAAYALGRIKDSTAIQPLIAALQDEDKHVCQAAAWALERLKALPAIQPMLDSLNSNDPKVRYSAASVLGELDDTNAVPALITILNDEDYRVRDAAATALGKLDDSKAVQPLIAALRDTEIMVRCSAVGALGELGEVIAVQPLIAALGDENSDVHGFAATALGEIGDVVAVPALLTALTNESSWVRHDAAQTLGKLGDRVAVSYLLDIFGYGGSRIEWSVPEALGQLGDRAAIHFLMAALIDQDANVRTRAAKALGRFQATQAIPLIVATSIAEQHSQAQQYATALIHLEPKSVFPILDRYANQFRRESWVERFRGYAFWRLGEVDAALNSFKKAAEKGNDDDLHALAHFYLEQAHLERAEELVARTLKRYPRFALYILSHAVLLWHKGESDKALEQLKRAQKRTRRIARINDLQYEHFWGPRAISALEAMLGKSE